MRNTFIVFAKLLGLYLLYLTIVAAARFGERIETWLSWPEPWRPPFPSILGSGARFLLSLALARLLIFKTGKVADWVKLKQVEGSSKPKPGHHTLVVGSVIVGLYALVFAIPALVTYLLYIMHGSEVWTVFESIESALQLGLGLILMLKAEAVAAFVGRRSQPEKQAPPPVGT